MGLLKYTLGKVAWYAAAFFSAVVLNFLLPRLVPGNPIDSIMASVGQAGASGERMRRVFEHYVTEFGLDQPIWQQFFTYLGNLVRFDAGTSFAQYPASVSAMILEALPWTIALQLPAIVVGWLIGNLIGALAAYWGGWFDRGAFLSSLLLSTMPQYCLAILLLYTVGVTLNWLPTGGGYSFGFFPEWSWEFFVDVIRHYWLPFFSIVLIFIGGQAVGMRSMAIYELGSDYVNYGRGLGLSDARIVRYIFRNAMLPQVSGLALAIGAMVGGALIVEIVFSYPGVGTMLFSALSQRDYPVIQALTLLIAGTVMLANFLVDITYGLIDPRIRAARAGER